MKIKGNWKTKQVFIQHIQRGWRELLPDESQKVHNHSPNGFNWSYSGSGPAQLALAIALEIMTKEDAVVLYQDLKRDLIAGLPASDFEIDFYPYTWFKENVKDI